MNSNETPQDRTRLQTSREEISRRAEELWHQYGRPQGRDEEIWFEAERQLQGQGDQLVLSSSPSERATASFGSHDESSATQKPRETELMEQRDTSPIRTGRGRGKSGGK